MVGWNGCTGDVGMFIWQVRLIMTTIARAFGRDSVEVPEKGEVRSELPLSLWAANPCIAGRTFCFAARPVTSAGKNCCSFWPEHPLLRSRSRTGGNSVARNGWRQGAVDGKFRRTCRRVSRLRDRPDWFRPFRQSHSWITKSPLLWIFSTHSCGRRT